MSARVEHAAAQARFLGDTEAIGWKPVSREEEAGRRRGFHADTLPFNRANIRSLFFGDLLDAKAREFNVRYAEAAGALLGQFRPPSRHLRQPGRERLVRIIYRNG